MLLCILLELRPASEYTPYRVYICCVCVSTIIMRNSKVPVAVIVSVSLSVLSPQDHLLCNIHKSMIVQ